MGQTMLKDTRMLDVCQVSLQAATDQKNLWDGLSDLLRDAVAGGASVGFLASISEETAARYWQRVASALGNGLCLWVATIDGRIVGTVQLAPCEKDNGRHRAEIQKLLVLRDFRGQGIASRMLAAAEEHAAAMGITLLMLDTEADSAAEAVYQHLGWQKVGNVPDHAATPAGELRPTAFYFKQIGPAAASVMGEQRQQQ